MLEESIPILTYHSLDETESVISISPSVFKKQMEFLHRNGYESLTLSELAQLLQRRKKLPPKRFVMTFDDGYQDNYIHGLPILCEFGFKATVFLVPNYCGKLCNWPGSSSFLGPRPLLSWSDIREMHRHGVEFGAHTLTHPNLTRIDRKRAEREIAESKAKIEDQLGDEVQTFAYPYGKFNMETVKVVRSHFIAACSTRLGPVTSGSDPFALNRIDMYYLRYFGLFQRISTRPLNGYLAGRQILRQLKEALT